jgi:hypothetical protein
MILLVFLKILSLISLPLVIEARFSHDTSPVKEEIFMNIRALPDSQVLSGLKLRVLKERENLTEVLEFLREVDRRRLYADSNHPSLWSFCTVELKYSAGAASRRIEAMRLLRDLPDLKEDLVSGKQNLSSLAMAQNFFRVEEKNQEEKLTPEKKQEVLNQLVGKSTRDCEATLVDLSSNPIEIKKPERKRAVGKQHTELKLVLDKELLEKLDRIKALRSHANPSMGYKELLEFMADEILKKHDPVEKAKAMRKPKVPTPAPELPKVKEVTLGTF